MFALEGIELTFTDDAVKTIAKRAARLRTGARALRAIMEEVMLDLMYEIPAKPHVKRVILTEGVIDGRCQQEILTA